MFKVVEIKPNYHSNIPFFNVKIGYTRTFEHNGDTYRDLASFNILIEKKNQPLEEIETQAVQKVKALLSEMISDH